MQKQKKQFMILCVALIVIFGIFLGLKAFNKHQEEQETAKEEAEKITAAALAVDKIQEFSYQYDGTEITFVKEDDTWYDKEDKTIPISQTMISSMLSNVQEITASQRISDAADISEYGFDKPQNVIRLTMQDEEITVTIGMYNSMTSQYYLMLSGDENVYLVDSSIYSAFAKSVEELTEEETEADTAEETTEEEADTAKKTTEEETDAGEETTEEETDAGEETTEE